MAVVLNDLYDYNNRYIYQDTDAFKFSLDSILLAEYANNYNLGSNVLDLCAGNMAVGLILSTYISSKIIGFEIQPSIYKLGMDSITYNNLNNLSIINDDVKNINKYFKGQLFDSMVCNPPFFKLNNGDENKNNTLNVARHEVSLTLDDIFSIAHIYLKDGGALYMVHRSDRLDDIIISADKNKIPVKMITLVTTKDNSNPEILLIKCINNGKRGIKVTKNVSVVNRKTYKNIFKEEL